VAFITACLVFRTIAVGHGPFSNQYEFAVAFAWGMAAVYVYFEHRYQVRTLGLVILPLTAGFLLYALSVGATANPLVPALQNGPLLTIHVAVAIFAYGALAVSFAAGLLYLIQPEQGRAGLPKPALLDLIGYRAVITRLPLPDADQRPGRSLGQHRVGLLLDLGPEGDGLPVHLARLRRLPARQGGPRLGRAPLGMAAHVRVRRSAADLLRQPVLRRPAQLRLSGPKQSPPQHVQHSEGVRLQDEPRHDGRPAAEGLAGAYPRQPARHLDRPGGDRSHRHDRGLSG